LPVEAQTTAGLFFIPRTSRTGIPAESRSEPVIPVTRKPAETTGVRTSVAGPVFEASVVDLMTPPLGWHPPQV
jgi:hypothetical protein